MKCYRCNKILEMHGRIFSHSVFWNKMTALQSNSGEFQEDGPTMSTLGGGSFAGAMLFNACFLCCLVKVIVIAASALVKKYWTHWCKCKVFYLWNYLLLVVDIASILPNHYSWIFENLVWGLVRMNIIIWCSLTSIACKIVRWPYLLHMLWKLYLSSNQNLI